MCYCIIFGIVNVCYLIFFQFSYSPQTRGYPYIHTVLYRIASSLVKKISILCSILSHLLQVSPDYAVCTVHT